MPRWSQLLKSARPQTATATTAATNSEVSAEVGVGVGAASAHPSSQPEATCPLDKSCSASQAGQQSKTARADEEEVPASAAPLAKVPATGSTPAAVSEQSPPSPASTSRSASALPQTAASASLDASQSQPQPRRRERPRWDAMLVGRHSTPATPATSATAPTAATLPAASTATAATIPTATLPAAEAALKNLPATSSASAAASVPRAAPTASLSASSGGASPGPDAGIDAGAADVPVHLTKPEPTAARPKRLAVSNAVLQNLLSSSFPRKEQRPTAANSTADVIHLTAEEPSLAAGIKDDKATVATTSTHATDEEEDSDPGRITRQEQTSTSTAQSRAQHEAGRRTPAAATAAATPAPESTAAPAAAAAAAAVGRSHLKGVAENVEVEEEDEDDVEDLEGLELMQAAEEELKLYNHTMAAVLAKEAEECLRQPKAREKVRRIAVLAFIADDRPHEANSVSLQPSSLAKAEYELALGRARPALLTAEAALKKAAVESKLPKKMLDSADNGNDDDSHAQALELVARAGLKTRTVAGSRRAVAAAEELITLRHEQTVAAGSQPPSSWSCSAVAKEMLAMVFLASLHRERHELELAAAVCSSVFDVPSPSLPEGTTMSAKTKMMLKKEEGLAEAQALVEMSTITRLLAEAGQEDAEVAISHAQDAVELSRRLGDRKLECLARCALAEAYHSDTLLSLALEAAQAAVVLARDLPLRALQRDCLELVSKLLLPAKACQFLTLELESARKREDLWLEREVLYKLSVLRAYDDRAKAKQIADEALAASKGDPQWEAKANRTAAEMYFILGDTRQALSALERAQRLFLQAGQVAAASEALKSRATTCEEEEDFTAAIAAAKARVRAFSMAGWREEEALAQLNLATLTAKCSPIGEALDIVSKALRLCEAVKFPAGEAEASLAIASMQLHYSSNVEEARRSADKARRLFEKLEEPTGEAKACKLYGLALSKIHDQQRMPRVVEFASGALKRSLALGDRRGEAECLQVLADLHYSLVVDEMDMGCRPPGDKLEESLNLFMLAAAAWDGLRERSLQANCMIQLSTLYMADEDGDAAVQAAKEAKELASKLDDVAPEAAALLALAESHAFRGDWQEAQDAAEEAKSAYEDMQDHEGMGEAEDILRKATRKLRSKAKPTPRIRSTERRASKGPCLWKSVMENMQSARCEEVERSEQRLQQLLPWRTAEDVATPLASGADQPGKPEPEEPCSRSAEAQQESRAADVAAASPESTPHLTPHTAGGREGVLATDALAEGSRTEALGLGVDASEAPDDEQRIDRARLEPPDIAQRSDLDAVQEAADEDAIVLSRIISTAVHLSTSGSIDPWKRERDDVEASLKADHQQKAEEEVLEEEQEEQEARDGEKEEKEEKEVSDEVNLDAGLTDESEARVMERSAEVAPDVVRDRSHFKVPPLIEASQRGDTWRPAQLERRWKDDHGMKAEPQKDNEALQADCQPQNQGHHPAKRGSGPLRPPGQWHVPPTFADESASQPSLPRATGEQHGQNSIEQDLEDTSLGHGPGTETSREKDVSHQTTNVVEPCLDQPDTSSPGQRVIAGVSSFSSSSASVPNGSTVPTTVPSRSQAPSSRGFSSFSSFAATRRSGGGGEGGGGGGGARSSGDQGHLKEARQEESQAQAKGVAERDMEQAGDHHARQRRGSDSSVGSASGSSGRSGSGSGSGRSEARRRTPWRNSTSATCEHADIPVVDLREAPVMHEDEAARREDDDIEEVYREDLPRSLDDVLRPDFKQPWFGDVMNVEAEYLNEEGHYEAVTVQFADEAGNGVFRMPSGPGGPIEFFHMADDVEDLEWIEDDDVEYGAHHMEDEVSSCDSEELEIEYFPTGARAT